MIRVALIASSIASATMTMAAPASACIPALERSPEAQQAVDLAEQSAAWANAETVYVALIVEVRAIPAGPDQPTLPPGASPTRQIVLVADQVLKGSLARSERISRRTQTPSCTPSDVERGRVGDRFVVYAAPTEPSAQDGVIALDRIRHPETLAALARASRLPAIVPIPNGY